MEDHGSNAEIRHCILHSHTNLLVYGVNAIRKTSIHSVVVANTVARNDGDDEEEKDNCSQGNLEDGIYGKVGGKIVLGLRTLVVESMQQRLQVLLHPG